MGRGRSRERQEDWRGRSKRGERFHPDFLLPECVFKKVGGIQCKMLKKKKKQKINKKKKSKKKKKQKRMTNNNNNNKKKWKWKWKRKNGRVCVCFIFFSFERKLKTTPKSGKPIRKTLAFEECNLGG